MVHPFHESFAGVPYPCYWLGADGEFWMNDTAGEIDDPLYQGDILRRLLASYIDASSAGAAPQPWLGNATRLWGLSVLPLEKGVFAAMSGQFEPPGATLGSMMRNQVHEIVTALSTLSKGTPPDAGKPGDSILEAAERTQGYCYTLLRLASNLENADNASQPPVNLAYVDLAEFTRGLFLSVEQVLPNRDIPIELSLPELPLPVRANSKKLEEAILNIVRNSLQYTKDGNRIRVSLRRAGRRALLTIEDAGMGIAPENLIRIFEPYFSADPYGEPYRPGLGLGLSVAQEIARAHGGTVTCESRHGEGTSVSLALPLEESNEPLKSVPANTVFDKYAPVFVHLEGIALPPAVE